MTSYHGGKYKTGKIIAENIFKTVLEFKDFKPKGYCEPFCGMLGVYKHIPDFFDNKFKNMKYKAGDINKSVIEMWKALQNGWKPNSKTISRKEFLKLSKNGKSSPLKGFVGFHNGFMGKYFKPFNKTTVTRNKNKIKELSNIADTLQDVKFKSGSYTQYSNLKNYIIYCDPPYYNKKNINKHIFYYDENGISFGWNQKKFLNWCLKMSKHNILFISGYTYPNNFEKIKTIKTTTHMHIESKNNLYLLY